MGVVRAAGWATPRRIGLGLAAAAVAIAGVAGCASSVPKDEVEKKAAEALKQQVGAPPKSITCPEDLPAEKGETMNCTLKTPEDETYRLAVEVTKVDGGNAEFNVEVTGKAKQ